ncbi:WD40 repeat domain-containing protein [Actinoplanes cyaneus]|uniref:WD40 repeat domain-containing protein n=1 Tax=Actinoplanes cyaneus TaxID=52696 RepID=UPI001944E786|nr:WD40 repeat domain-containing protein [Actinoplanes cyaneus]
MLAALEAAGLIEPVPADELPPPEAFATSVLLTGLTVEDAVRRLAEDLRLSQALPDLTASTSLVDWLISAMGAPSRYMRSRLTLLLDALDEAQQPLAMAGLIVRLAALPWVRVVVGTRSSLHAVPDGPVPADTELLNALRADGLDSDVLLVERDDAAVGRYVSRRLTAALGSGQEPLIAALTFGVQVREQEFLFARLAVHELLARPGALRGAPDGGLARLLAGNHRTLFAAAVDRLTAANPGHRALLAALALGLGRGLPLRDQVWLTVASALGPWAPTAEDLSALLDEAAPYLMLDSEAGQTVYRLAHRTFQEYLLTELAPAQVETAHARIVDALIELAGSGNPYVTRRLSAHAIRGGATAIQRLGDRPDVIDRLDPHAVAFDILRADMDPAERPATLIGVLTARRQLIGCAAGDRAGIRRLAMARHAGITVFAAEAGDTAADWAVNWAYLAPVTPHVILADSPGRIAALVGVRIDDGRALVAAAGWGSAILLWDSASGEPLDPLTGHRGVVAQLATLPTGADDALLVSAGADRTIRLWDPAGRRPARELPGVPGRGLLSALATAAPPGKEPIVASADVENDEAKVWLWHAGTETRTLIATELDTLITALTVTATRDGRTLVAGAADNATIQVWERGKDGEILRLEIGETGRVLALTPVHLNGADPLLAAGGEDASIRLWDPITGQRVGRPFMGHDGPVTALTVLPGPDGRTLLASAGEDNTIRLRDIATGRPHGAPLTGHTQPITALAVVTAPNGTSLLVSGGHDATVRLWDVAAAKATPRTRVRHTGRIADLAVVHAAGCALLATAGDDGTIRLTRCDTGEPYGEPLTGHTGPVTALTTVAGTRGDLLVSAGDDGTIRAWDPVTGQPEGQPILGLPGSVRRLITVPDPAGFLVAGAGDAGVGLWDLRSGRPVAAPWPYRTVPVDDLAITVGLDEQPLLALALRRGVVELWDLRAACPAGTPLAGQPGGGTALIALTGPDGDSQLMTADMGGALQRWDPVTGDPAAPPIAAHLGGALSLAVVPGADSAPMLATLGQDATIRLWSADDTCQQTIPLGLRMHVLCWTGHGLAVAGDDGVALVTPRILWNEEMGRR